MPLQRRPSVSLPPEQWQALVRGFPVLEGELADLMDEDCDEDEGRYAGHHRCLALCDVHVLPGRSTALHGHLQAHLNPICVLAKCLHMHCMYLSMCMYILAYADCSEAKTSQYHSVRA